MTSRLNLMLNSSCRFEHLSPIVAYHRTAMAQRGSQGARVVSIGTNCNVLALRHAVLELGGFEVSSTSSMPLAQALIRHERCGVLLLCYSVPENWRKTLIPSFREFCPNGRIVGIRGGDLKHVSESFDVVISSTDKADVLLKAILGRERRRQNVAA
jgi:hypothetical protein